MLLRIFAQALVPVFLAVEALGDSVTGRHRADEIVFFQSRKCFWADQVDALVSQPGPDPAEFFQRQLGVAPLAEGLLEMAIVNRGTFRQACWQSRGIVGQDRSCISSSRRATATPPTVFNADRRLIWLDA